MNQFFTSLRFIVPLSSLVFAACIFIAYFRAFPDPLSKFKIPIVNHQQKEPVVAYKGDKLVYIEFSGDIFPTFQQLHTIKDSSADFVIVEFPKDHSTIEDWKSNFSSFISSLNSYSLKYAFSIQSQEYENFTRDTSYIVENYKNDPNYMKLNNKLFITYLQKEDKHSAEDFRQYTNEVFPCAIFEDRHAISYSYQEGINCYTSLGNPDSYAWSANPQMWDQAKSMTSNLASMFIPIIQDKFKHSDMRRHDMEFMDHYRPDEDLPYPEAPMPLPPEPENMNEEERKTREEQRQKYDREMDEYHRKVEERERIRNSRLDERLRNQDPRSDFKYAYEYALKLSSYIIGVRASSNDFWNPDNNTQFTNEVHELVQKFKQ